MPGRRKTNGGKGREVNISQNRSGRYLSRIAIVAAALLVCCWAPATAGAGQTVTLQTSFSPDRLGASTTIGFGFQITSTTNEMVSPLTGVRLRLPPGIDYVTTTLGLAVCRPASLLADGLSGCSPNSRLGSGEASVELPFGRGSGDETSDIQVLMGPAHDGNLAVLFYASGIKPISTQLVFQGELLTGSEVLGGSLKAAVPLVASIPGGPFVPLVSLQATIGPSHLTYYRRAHGRTVAFHPQGVSVPLRCPRGGFPFAASFTFFDGSSAVASSVVPCPPGRHG
jgi:hypothetical protein